MQGAHRTTTVAMRFTRVLPVAVERPARLQFQWFTSRTFSLVPTSGTTVLRQSRSAYSRAIPDEPGVRSRIELVTNLPANLRANRSSDTSPGFYLRLWG